jgi:hypothetical protein
MVGAIELRRSQRPHTPVFAAADYPSQKILWKRLFLAFLF